MREGLLAAHQLRRQAPPFVEHQAQCKWVAREMPQQQVLPEEAQQAPELAPEVPRRSAQLEQEPELAPEVQQEAPPEASADQEAEQEDASPKAGRRRRRRRHRRGSAAASDDDSGPSPRDITSPLHGASPPATPNRNVVTWSDLGEDGCVLSNAHPVRHVAPILVSSSLIVSACRLPGASLPANPKRNVVTWSDLGEADGALRKTQPAGRAVHTGPQPANFMATAAPPMVFVGPPMGPVWPVQWHAAQAVHGSGVQQTGMEAEAEWTDKDSHELRQWLCGNLGGVAVPHMSDLADLLQDLSQTQAYED